MTRSSSSDGGGSADRHFDRPTDPPTHDRLTFRTTDEQLAAIESLVEADVYPNRSEVIRAGIEAVLERQARAETDDELE